MGSFGRYGLYWGWLLSSVHGCLLSVVCGERDCGGRHNSGFRPLYNGDDSSPLPP